MIKSGRKATVSNANGANMQDYTYKNIAKFETIAGVEVPVDEDGHYLDWQDQRQGPDGKPQARDLTSPYGALEYAVGYDDEDEGDWMRCFDYAELPDGRIVLHAVTNSESGSFIEGSGYHVATKDEAPFVAMEMIEETTAMIFQSGQSHDEEGWNQDPYYFVRAVAKACGVEPYASTQEDLRRGEVPNF